MQSKMYRKSAIIQAITEPLEGRRLMTAAVWTGTGGNQLFSNPANWQGNAVPTSGEDVQFNNLSSAQTVDVDTARTVGNVSVAGNYTFTDQNLTINGNVEADANASLTFSNTIVPTANNHFTSDAGATISLSTISDSTSNTFSEYGPGTIVFNGSTAANWNLLSGTMDIEANTAMNLTQTGGVATTAVNQAHVNSYTETNSDLTLTQVGNGTINFASTLPVTLNGGTYITTVQDQFNYGALVTNANQGINLVNHPTLQVNLGNGFVPTVGDTYYILTAGGDSGATTGSFSNLTIGDNFDVGNVRFASAYSYGYDILTVAGAVPTIALTSTATSVAPGTPITLTATLTGTGTAPTGTVTFSSNGTVLGTGTIANGVATLSIPTLTAGTYPIIATFGGDQTYLDKASTPLSVTSAVPITGPTVTTTAAATVSTAKSASLTVATTDMTTTLANGIKYTWSAVRIPSGAKTPVFSVNGTHAAATTAATFTKSGTYHLRVTAKDANGATTTSDVDYVVQQSARALRLSPHKFKVASDHSQKVTAVAIDQFGHGIIDAGAPSFVVNSGSGSISSAGLFTAGSVFGHVVVQCTLDGLTGTIGATVV